MIDFQLKTIENLLKKPSEENGGSETDILVEDETSEQISAEDKFIRCAQCLNAIAKSEDQISPHRSEQGLRSRKLAQSLRHG